MNAESTVHTRKTKWKKVSPYRRRKFTKALNHLFRDTDLLQKKLAVELEVTDALISYYLNGTRTILPDHLFAMCIALHLDTHTQRQLFDILDWSLPDAEVQSVRLLSGGTWIPVRVMPQLPSEDATRSFGIKTKLRLPTREVSGMAKFIYKAFGDDVPRKIEKEYNRMLRQEQYQIERDYAHGVSTPEYDPLLHNVADRSLTPEYQAEAADNQLWQDRLSLLPIALDWLRMEYPDEYVLIRDYYYSDEPITLLYLAERYGVTKQALSKRLAAVRDRLRKFITAHENDR